RDGIAVDVAQPAQGRWGPDVEARFDDVNVMDLARAQHHPMSGERDGLPVMVLRVVDDADALHGAVASGVMTASSRSLARRAEPHYCTRSKGVGAGQMVDASWGQTGAPSRDSEPLCLLPRHANSKSNPHFDERNPAAPGYSVVATARLRWHRRVAWLRAHLAPRSSRLRGVRAGSAS